MVAIRLALDCATEALEMVQPFGDFDWMDGRRYVEDEAYAAYFGDPQPDRPRFIFIAGTGVEEMPVADGMVVSAEEYPSAVKFFGEAQVMGLLEGDTPERVFGLLGVYRGAVAVPCDILAVPDHPDPPWVMALKRALIVSSIPADRIVHLVGFCDIGEFFWYRGRPNVASLITAMPALLGMEEKYIVDLLDVGGGEGGALERMASMGKPTHQQYTGILANIALLRREMP